MFSSLFVLVFLAAGIIFFLSRRKKKSKKSLTDAPAWAEVADGLFTRHLEESPKNKVELALRTGLRKLAMNHGIICSHEGNECQILYLVSDSYEKFSPLSSGQVIPSSLLYCGMMNERRDSIVIDFASLSEWRRHRAFVELGWESYIGVKVSRQAGSWLTIGFFHPRARESLFTSSEKEFVHQLARWIFAILEREKAAPLEKEAMSFREEPKEVPLSS